MKTALHLRPAELQNVTLPDSALESAVSLARAANDRVRDAADTRLRFDDEPAAFLAFLHAQP
jgi:hypothetical protein